MIELAGLALLRPWWLLALPPLLAAAFVTVRRQPLRAWSRAIDAPLLAGMAARGGVLPGASPDQRAVVAAAALILVGLIGPAVERTRVSTFRNLDALVLCLDASRSLTSGGNLVAATAAARALAEAAAGRQVAVVVYAGDAYLAAALTADREDLATTLASIDGDTVPDVGSRPERALALAREVLDKAAVLQADVVLMSDGGTADGDVAGAAAALARRGHALHTVHVPPSAAYAGVVPSAGRGDLDRLAASAGGLATGLADVDRLVARLAQRRELRLAAGDYAALAWRDLGWFFALAAALPLLLLFRREAA
jgi:Ca-activated chloride channel family protein